MLSRSNCVVALCPAGSDMMSLDINYTMPAAPSQQQTASASETASSRFSPVAGSRFQKSMARSSSEPAGKCLERLKLLLSRSNGSGEVQNKRTSKPSASTQQPQGPTIGFTVKKMKEDDITEGATSSSSASPPVVTLNDTNLQFWSQISHLLIDETQLSVLFNIPTVIEIHPPSTVVAGLPVVCTGVQVLFASTADLVHQWYVIKPNVSGGEVDVERDCSPVVGTDAAFTPTPDLVGRRLIYRCCPNVAVGQQGALWTQIELPAVLPPIDHHARWVATRDVRAAGVVTPTAFRVMTYNVLHEDFCTSKFAKLKIYPFASDDILSLSRRKLLVAQEIKDANPDIVCLQECGHTVFTSYYQPVLQQLGFECLYTNKNGTVREGCMTGFRRDRYQLVGQVTKPLVMSTLKESHPELAREIQDAHPHLEDALQRITSVASITVLRDVKVPERVVLVGNTHLFYHAQACHIRALQAWLLLHLLNDVKQGPLLSSDAEREQAAVVLCGDFNFTRITGGYRLMTEGVVEESNNCWDKGYAFWWGIDKQLGVSDSASSEIDEQAATPTTVGTTAPAALSQPPTAALKTTLVSPFPKGLCDTHIDTPMQWTNYALTFKEIIDHIFVDKENVEVLRTIHLPRVEEVSCQVAIPNTVFPSDHVSLVCELDYAKKKP